MKQLQVELTDRVLRFDGVSIVSPEMVARCLLLGIAPTMLRVTKGGWELEQFNDNVPEEEQLKVVAEEPINLSYRWQLPEEYSGMDLREYILEKTTDWLLASDYSEQEQLKAMHRIGAEMIEIEKRGMVEFFKTIIYVLDTFRKTGVVWGVGRGSSCASYILFILGLHAVDCFRFNVPMEEFFHE